MSETQEPTTPPQVEQSAVASDPVIAREAQAFETYVNANNVPVPDNFKSVGDWFSALKSAQGEYTKARQEISQLKKQMTQAEPVVTKAQEQPAEPPVPKIPEELRIPDKPKEPEPSAQQAAQKILTQEEWTKYSTEFTVNGNLSEESRLAIRDKLNVPDFVIDDFMQGQKARLQNAYSEAAQRVGGKDTLARVFDWASKNLTQQEQTNVNAALASPSWEVTLLGLKTKYENAQAGKVTANEPAKTATTKVGVGSASTVNNLPYGSKAEFYTERSDPRFKTDPKFRQAVELRMSRTNFNNLR
jgi:hypothetical protein